MFVCYTCSPNYVCDAISVYMCTDVFFFGSFLELMSLYQKNFNPHHAPERLYRCLYSSPPSARPEVRGTTDT